MRLVVVGCGSMGSHLAMAMSREGHFVSVVDQDASSRQLLGDDARVKFIHGVGIDLDVLSQSGIEAADAVAAVTGSDNVNLAVAMIARKRFRVPSVVARVFDPGKLEPYSTAGIHVICPPAWGFRVIADILTHPAREDVLTLGHGEIRVVVLRIGQRGSGTLVKHITTPEVSLVAVVRNGVAMLPGESQGLLAGDVVYMRVPEAHMATFDRLVDGLEG